MSRYSLNTTDRLESSRWGLFQLSTDRLANRDFVDETQLRGFWQRCEPRDIARAQYDRRRGGSPLDHENLRPKTARTRATDPS